MAERRKARSGTGGRTSTRSREPSGRDEREMLEAEPEALEEDELLDADEPEEADDEIRDADEPEAADEDEMLDADEDEMLDADETEAADQDESLADGQRRQPARRSRKAMTAGEAAKAALREIAALTAKQPEGVTEVERTEDGWTVGIELVEDRRIPSSSDILAIYETTIDADGELLSYRRVRRYARGRGDTEES
jgi:Gas vesicle synthesis protein GvpO